MTFALQTFVIFYDSQFKLETEASVKKNWVRGIVPPPFYEHTQKSHLKTFLLKLSVAGLTRTSTAPNSLYCPSTFDLTHKFSTVVIERNAFESTEIANLNQQFRVNKIFSS